MSARRAHYAWQIRRGRFKSPEPEFSRLSAFVNAGDWVLDVGANVGHYTRALSCLVGNNGRVIAVEPVAATFSLLAANVAELNNVTLINAAASDVMGEARLVIPGGNEYLSRLDVRGLVKTLKLPLDWLRLPRITFIKVDVEGHEIQVLRGLSVLLRRDRPYLVVEGKGGEVADFLGEYGYQSSRLHGSPNTLWVYVPPRAMELEL